VKLRVAKIATRNVEGFGFDDLQSNKEFFAQPKFGCNTTRSLSLAAEYGVSSMHRSVAQGYVDVFRTRIRQMTSFRMLILETRAC
jgi:hypothetical protein